MELYAIRHKPSGMLMPLVHRGSTHLHLPWGIRPPRLFTKKRSAVVALSWWLKGVVTPSYRTDWKSGYTETRGLDVEPRADRKADDMEVVAVTLTTRSGARAMARAVSRKDFDSNERFVWTKWRFEHAVWFDPAKDWPKQVEGYTFTLDPKQGVVCNGIIVEPKEN